MPIQLSAADQAIAYVIANEGTAFTASKFDRGVCSRYGVTQASLTAWRGKPMTCDDVGKLTVEEASAFYKMRYWDALHLGDIGSQKTATAYLDMAVLTGPRTSTRIMQLCVGVLPDYIVGPKTLAAINGHTSNDLLVTYGQGMQAFFISLVRKDATQAKWLYGWLCRASKLMMLAF